VYWFDGHPGAAVEGKLGHGVTVRLATSSLAWAIAARCVRIGATPMGTVTFVPDQDRVEIVDVGPRDGLQNLPDPVPTELKLELIGRLIDAGVRSMEACSFVNPAKVPQMGDADAVMAGVPRHHGARYLGLVLNERGLDRAISAGVDEVVSVVVCSNTFSQRNQGTTITEALEVHHRIGERANAAGMAHSVVMSAAFGCPFEGDVPVDRVARIAIGCASSGPTRVTLADTIGVGVPTQVHELVRAVRDSIGEDVPLGAHFHNTRNTGYANAYAALEVGIRSFDASLGGVGGCPFAPRATGNIATEDLVYQLHQMGFDTGIDLESLIDTSNWLAEHLGAAVAGLVAKAGGFPTPGTR
jgi:hydroxymethylglutaryl-CoA lyase